VRTAPAVFHCIDVLLPSQYFASTASQGGLLAQPPLAIPPGTRLRGPAGTLRCSAWAGAGRTRLCEPQTGCRPVSCQPCATRPR